MLELFDSLGIEENLYNIYECSIEDFYSERKYPIIIAEGFIQNLNTYDQKKIIKKLSSLVIEGGVIVITCADVSGFFVEQLKRLIAYIIIKDINDENEKTEKLLNVFAPQLDSLKGMSREKRDWIQDQFLNPAVNNNLLSLFDAITYFDDDFEFMGSSQSIFTDYSWYKDVFYKNDFEMQYNKKRHNFVLTNLEETLLSIADSDFLNDRMQEVRNLAIKYENNFADDLLVEIRSILEELLELSIKIDKRFYGFLNDMILILKEINVKKINLKDYPYFFSSFGRGLQYLCMVKKMKY